MWQTVTQALWRRSIHQFMISKQLCQGGDWARTRGETQTRKVTGTNSICSGVIEISSS